MELKDALASGFKDGKKVNNVVGENGIAGAKIMSKNGEFDPTTNSEEYLSSPKPLTRLATWIGIVTGVLHNPINIEPHHIPSNIHLTEEQIKELDAKK